MKTRFLAAVATVALIALPSKALAQHAHMPGMNMPGMDKPAPKKPAAKKPAQTKKSVAKKATSKRAEVKTSSSTAPDSSAPPGGHQSHEAPQEPTPVDHSRMDHSKMDHGEMQMAEPASSASARQAVQPQVDHDTMVGMDHGSMAHGEHSKHEEMVGALGSYPMQREASGTAWQPDTSEHSGLMEVTGNWTLMAHGVVNLVYDHQSGRRGDDKAFFSGMLMGMARRPVGDGVFQLKAMVSPDPLMGKSGYPLLLASGETANGMDRLIDRQHPHDFFMELSGSLSQNIGAHSSVFIYGGLPGEPAFGPPAFMHREAIMDSPEAPISHHWLDSTHISFGVLTGGIILGNAKLELSRFNGREPDQHRWNIETGPLDSTAVRLSWNPSRELALQGSWGHFEDPEQLEPGVDQKRWSASALYSRDLAPGWKFAGTLAWGRKTIDHHGESLSDDAYVAEASLKHRDWTIFGRGEITENRELLEGVEHGSAYRVGKVSLGAVKDFRLAEHFSLGAGGLLAVNFIPDGLQALYGKSNPLGAMGFVRLKLE